MIQFRRFVGVVGAVAALAVAGPSVLAQASESDQVGPAQAAFVQTNDPAGNSIVAYRRNPDGTLTETGIFATGGKGGKELPGTQSDPLGSQGSLVFDTGHRLLVAVNAGSNTITVFRVEGTQLERMQILSSGGPFPTSVAIRGNLAYVLDAGASGFVSGFRIQADRLEPIAGSTRTLGLANSTPPFFLSSPAQVGFTPNGQHLLVTTKTHSSVEVFQVEADGLLSAQPTVNPEGPVPFPFIFDPAGLLTLVTAGNSAAATFRVNADGNLTPVGTAVSDGQAAACWIVSARRFDYVANTASNDLSQYRVNADGTVTLVNAAAASGIPGATDMATADGRYLYVLSGSTGAVDAFSVGAGGALTLIQSQPVPDGSSIEGIVAG